MAPDDRLSEVFDRSHKRGFQSLSPGEHELWLIQDFILEQESNGLSGYFYNRLPNLGHVLETVIAMRKHGLGQLAELLGEAAALFSQYVDPHPPTTWEKVVRLYDPYDRLRAIAKEIDKLDNYGLAESTIT